MSLLISSIERSLLLNSQLSYNNKATISFISNTSLNLSSNLITDIYDIDQLKLKDYSTIPIFKLNTDIRLPFFKSISSSTECNLSIYFPLTQEKYIFTCLSKRIHPFEKDSFLKEGLSMEIQAEYKHINQINDFINIDCNTLIETYWKNLSEEEKLAFDVFEPGTIKSKDTQNDIDRFESQEKVEPMRQFGVVLFIPIKAERTVYPRPQVIANTRKQNFESLYQPRKTIKKYNYTLKNGEFEYDVNELNV